MKAPRNVFLIGLAAVGALAFHASRYLPFLSDDALITLRYVRRFLQGHGLTWTDGERVEGYSNFLWLLGTALLGSLGIDLILAVRILGVIGMASVIGALAFWHVRTQQASLVPLAVACFVWVAAAPVAIWSIGGLEQPLVAGLLAWAIALAVTTSEDSKRPLHVCGLLLGLLCLTRPDGALFAVAFATWFVASRRLPGSSWSRAVAILSLPLALTVLQIIFRLVYYGDWLPNTAYVKVAPSLVHLQAGLAYLGSGMAMLRPLGELTALGFFVLLKSPSDRRTTSLLLILVVTWLGYVAFIGGDIQSGARHLVPFIVVMAFLLGELIAWGMRFRAWVPVTLILSAWFVFTQIQNTSNPRIQNEQWVWNAEAIATLFKDGFAEKQPLLAVTAAGSLPYWTELPALDLLGLCDREIARTATPGFESSWIGHGRANMEYVMERRPDLMVFGTGGGGMPNFAYKDVLFEVPEFADNYWHCRFGAPLPGSDSGQYFICNAFVNRNSEAIGIVRSNDELYVPAYLLTLGHSFARLDANDDFFVSVGPQDPIGILGLELEPGRWLVRSPSEGVMVGMVAHERTLPSTTVGGLTAIDVPRSAAFDVLITSRGPGAVHVEGLRLQRLVAPDAPE